MIGDWIAQWPALLAAVAVVFAPGLLIGAGLRLRGLWLWGLAPVISTGALTASALLLGAVGIGWTPVSAAVGTLVFAVIAFCARWILFPDRVAAGADPDPASRVLLAAGIGVGAALTAARVILYIGDPAAISQTNDAIFHLSALRFAVETGHASPLELGQVIGSGAFYPSGWHVLAALIPQMVGTSVEVAANAVSFVIATLVWPFGLALFTRTVGGATAAAFTAALAVAIPTFPMLMLQYGVLYPQSLAIALLPAALAVVAGWRALAIASRGGRALRPVVLVLLVLAAIGSAQPATVLAWGAAAMLFVVSRIILGWSEAPRSTRVAGVLGAIVALCALVLVWVYSARSIGTTWPSPYTRIVTAGLEILGNGYLGSPWVVGVSVLMLIGIVSALMRADQRWLVAAWACFALLFLIGASVGIPAVRAIVTPWYEDSYRLAAMMPVVAVPLTGIGLSALISWLARAMPALRHRALAWTALTASAGLLAVTIVVTPQLGYRDVINGVWEVNPYRAGADSYLSVDERTLLRRLADSVPEDGVVVGNPSTAMAFGYALSGRDVIPRSWSPPRDDAYDVLRDRLRDVGTDPDVCHALDELGARYVLDFGPGQQSPGKWVMPGFTDLAGQPGFRLIDSEGDASLWYVDACGSLQRG